MLSEPVYRAEEMMSIFEYMSMAYLWVEVTHSGPATGQTESDRVRPVIYREPEAIPRWCQSHTAMVPMSDDV